MLTTFSMFGWTTRLLAALAVATVIGLVVTIRYAAPVSALDYKFYLDCPTTEVVEGDSIDVYLVFNQYHDWLGWFAHWHTDAGTAGSSDYVHQDTGAIWASYHERVAMRASHTVETTEDSLAEGNETFTVRFSPVDSVVDRDDPERDEKCEITIIDDDPNITDVEVTSSPASEDTYGVGETIEISATFSTDVEVNGNPGLGLWVGGTWRAAMYLRGSGTDTLVFGYTVKSEDSDSDGIKMDGGYQDSNERWHNFLNHTAVTAVGSDTVAYRVYAGIDDQSGHKVDGSIAPVGTNTAITSSRASGDTYRYGETIEFSITFSAALDVDGGRHLSLRVGSDDSDGWRGAMYRSGSGTKTLVFGYTVQSGDLDADGVTLLGTWTEDGVVHGIGGSGTIKVKGTDTVVTPTFTGLSNQSDHKLNGQPYHKTISITSTPVSKSDTYGRDEVIQVSVTFDQNVTAGDDAVAFLRVDSIKTRRIAQYASGNGTDTLVFEYTVVEKDYDDNGVGAFLPHGLNIKATGTEVRYQPNPGGVTPQMSEDPNHKVDSSLVTADTTAPTISSVSFGDSPGPGDDDTYGAGDAIQVTVTFSEDVTVTGTPQMEIDVGGTVKTASYSSTDGTTLVFGYTVQEGDADSDGISISANKVSLNGGTIQDEAGNNAVLTHDAVANDDGHKVDAPDVTAPTISSVAFTSDPGDDDTYGVRDSIEVTVTFSEDVTLDVSGTLQLELDVGGTAKNASYSSADGAEVVFSYTVASGDADADGIAIGENKIDLNDGTIQDSAENDATLTHDAVAADSGHKVDGVGPTVSSVSITSDPGDDDTYSAGDTIQITVDFTEDVTVTDAPQLEIDIGGTAKTASYSSTDGDEVVFSYTVVVGDADTDGIAISADKLSLNGGTINDAHGNGATLTHDAVAADTGHLVSAPGGL